MSSSLDDLEPYEIFQNELDEYLRANENYLKKNKAEFPARNFLVIHQFIEYICFIKSKSCFEEIYAEEIKVDFIKFLNEKSGNKIDSLQVVAALKEYFLFIDQHYKNPGSEIVKRLKI